MSRLKVDNIETRSGNNVAMDNSLQLKSYTTAEMNALTATAGDIIFNSTDGVPYFYNGTAWGELATAPTAISYLVIAGGASGGFNNGGGGGAGAAGGEPSSSSSNNGANGGIGAVTTILTASTASTALVGEVSSNTVYFSGGGGGSGASTNGTGGLGGGGNGGSNDSGDARTGGGCGGTYATNVSGTGGSGVVIIRYPATTTLTTIDAGLTHNTYTEGDYKVTIFTAGTGSVTV